MAYLKSAPSDFYPDTELTELTALQRLQYLEYLSGEESLINDAGQDAGHIKISAMNIRVSAHLVALALMKTKRSDVDPLDDEACKAVALQLQREILGQWSWEGIAASALQVRRLSGMLPPESTQEVQEETEALTVEKS